MRAMRVALEERAAPAPPTRAHGGHAEGLLAVAVTGALGSRTDWAAPWHAGLRAPRRHPVADVRDAALDEVTAYE